MLSQILHRGRWIAAMEHAMAVRTDNNKVGQARSAEAFAVSKRPEVVTLDVASPPGTVPFCELERADVAR